MWKKKKKKAEAKRRQEAVKINNIFLEYKFFFSG